MNLAPSVTRDARESPPQPCINATWQPGETRPCSANSANASTGARGWPSSHVLADHPDGVASWLPAVTANLMLANVQAVRLQMRRVAVTGTTIGIQIVPRTIFENHPFVGLTRPRNPISQSVEDYRMAGK
jgi:hypothetical protein